MFRALLFLSSGGQIVLIKPLVSSLSLGDCSVHSTQYTVHSTQYTPVLS